MFVSKMLIERMGVLRETLHFKRPRAEFGHVAFLASLLIAWLLGSYVHY
jgi:hypothetical protein